jgi:uncharacterized Rossmann fold enzyme
MGTSGSVSHTVAVNIIWVSLRVGVSVGAGVAVTVGVAESVVRGVVVTDGDTEDPQAFNPRPNRIMISQGQR